MLKETDITSGIGNRVREISKIAGSQTLLSKSSGVGLRLIQSYISEDASMKVETAARLAKAAGVDLTWLLTGEGSSLPVQQDVKKSPDSIDWELMTAIIKEMSKELDKHDRTLKGKKFAKYLRLLYELETESNDQEQPINTAKILQMVSSSR